MNNIQRHHIICKSRADEGYRVHDRKNIVLVEDKFHVNFHRLFQNRTPQEQLDLIFQVNKGVLSLEVKLLIEDVIRADKEEVYQDRFLC